MSIEVKGLSKFYGDQKALDDVSFSANKGEILGFLGPNGAGKSTTMKIATAFISADMGEVEVEGLKVSESPMEVKRIVGYLPEHNPLYLDMYVAEYLEFCAGLYGIKGAKRKRRVIDMIEQCGLQVERSKKIGQLSKGYRQRVGLAQALIHDPRFLILDEPTTGLDPNQLVEIRSLIKSVSLEKTVILSTHIMQEVQALCDRVVIINRGRIVADDHFDRLSERADGKHRVIVQFAKAIIPASVETISNVDAVSASDDQRQFEISCEKANSEAIKIALFELAVQENVPILQLTDEKGENLEGIFRELTNQDQATNEYS
ncbi:MAG: gliding motility-associated ABC transporter ATP-binding subunit GldA [Cyclobacteriaceae bacterium]|nr:gliding motility-associated ABC transporter ATP-binding subunit GldA [Cyclobacteriaceae bacterium]MCH8515733.1 gliding motility-associated ABC transporter ATP-binding subunit GldA [Cyclobacteriaceae bacterium]